MRLLIFIAAVSALTACHNAAQQNAPSENAATAESGPAKGVDRTHKGKPAPDSVFKDPDGEEVSLADLSGKPTLVNLWATWCAPCVKELPTLDRLAQDHEKAGDFHIVAVSQDNAPHASVVAFLGDHRIKQLESYQDARMGLSGALNAEILPTTVLFDAQGREVWRYVGDLDWTGPEAARLLAEGGVTTRR